MFNVLKIPDNQNIFGLIAFSVNPVLVCRDDINEIRELAESSKYIMVSRLNIFINKESVLLFNYEA